MTKDTQHVFAFSGLQVGELIGALCGFLKTSIQAVAEKSCEEREAWVRHIERQTILLEMLRGAVGEALSGETDSLLDSLMRRADDATSKGEER